jgi:hypothetical protein
VINVAEMIAGNAGKKHSYARKRNTASMIQNIVACLHIEELAGEGLWRLASLRSSWSLLFQSVYAAMPIGPHAWNTLTNFRDGVLSYRTVTEPLK